MYLPNRLKLAGATLFVAMIIVGCGRSKDSAHVEPEVAAPIVYEYRAESVDDLHRAIEADSATVVLDVRTPAEFDGPFGHVDGAILIPVQELARRMAELQELKGTEIHVICRSGNRSTRATNMLVDAGFNAVNVEGGMRAWSQTYPQPTTD